MDRIHEIARLEMCPDCKKHGEMIFPITGRIYIVFSKEQAFEFVRQEMIESTTLPHDQAVSIQEQISNSDLSDYPDDEEEANMVSEHDCVENSFLGMVDTYLGDVPSRRYFLFNKPNTDDRPN